MITDELYRNTPLHIHMFPDFVGRMKNCPRKYVCVIKPRIV